MIYHCRTSETSKSTRKWCLPKIAREKKLQNGARPKIFLAPFFLQLTVQVFQQWGYGIPTKKTMEVPIATDMKINSRQFSHV